MTSRRPKHWWPPPQPDEEPTQERIPLHVPPPSLPDDELPTEKIKREKRGYTKIDDTELPTEVDIRIASGILPAIHQTLH